jgi:MOSC domain-containing protein YiiM
MAEFFVSEVRVGRVRPLGPQGVPSGIRKDPVPGPVAATACGLEGDEQGDRRNHGGRDKAVHAYAAAHYPSWAADLPGLAAQLEPGTFGENLLVEGVVEADICLGDRWRLGGALLEVSQARQPCWRLNLRFERPDMARLVQSTGRTGWYFRVVEPGEIAAGQTARLEARPHPEWSLDRVWRLLYRDRLDRAALAAFAALPGLPERWRTMAAARVASGRTEDWTRRLETPR